MSRVLTCIVCPMGCQLTVKCKDDAVESITGNQCKRGSDYAYAECVHPTRMLTTTIRVSGEKPLLVPVKSEAPLPKEMLLECMAIIHDVQVASPITIGQVLIENIAQTGINIVATKNITK